MSLPNTARALLSTQTLSIGYAQKRGSKVLAEGLDLNLSPGQFICLLGPNGAGKTTLLRTLSGALPPLAGSIDLDGHALSDLTPRIRAERISVVLTGSMPPVSMQAKAFVALGRHPHSNWTGRLGENDLFCIDWALQTVDATALANRQMGDLSDGERQKISIARALAQKAPIMLLDEPTAYLDLPHRIRTMALLRRLAHEKQMSILLSTHDLDLALKQADQLWLLDAAGSIHRDSPEALAREGLLAETFREKTLGWDALSAYFNAASPLTQSGQLPE